MSQAGFADVIAALSTDVVSRWAALGKPPLTQNRILLGAEYLYQEDAPPRIVAVPSTGNWRGKDVYTTTLTSIDTPSVYTWTAMVDFHCWGHPEFDVNSQPIEGADFNNTQLLFSQVILAANDAMTGNFLISGGRWTDAGSDQSHIARLGREYVFTMSFDVPVTEVPFQNVPPDTVASFEDFMDQPGQAPSTTVVCST